MRYLGGKSRLSKYIADILARNINGHKKYVEPFVGSAAVAEKLSEETNIPMILADAAPDLIKMYQAVQNGWVPPARISETVYDTFKNANFHSPLRGFIGYGCSWGGKFFGGYARGEDRNYAGESKRAIIRTVSKLKNVEFVLSDYRNLNINNALVYCDPPYRGTTSYEAVPEFNSGEYWQKAREWSTNNTVFSSEYFAPDDFVCIWEKGHTTSIRPKGGNEKRVERLFVHESIVDKINLS